MTNNRFPDWMIHIMGFATFVPDDIPRAQGAIAALKAAGTTDPLELFGTLSEAMNDCPEGLWYTLTAETCEATPQQISNVLALLERLPPRPRGRVELQPYAQQLSEVGRQFLSQRNASRGRAPAAK